MTDATATVDLAGFKLVSVNRIEPNLGNIREHLGDLTELAASIREHGIIQPLVVYPDGPRFALLAGHRRLAAAKLAGLPRVPVIVRKEPSESKALQMMLVENSQRANLDPIEEARAIRRLIDSTSCSQLDAARLIGHSQTWVSRRLAFLALPLADQEALRRGETSMIAVTAQAYRAQGTKKKGGGARGWHLGVDHPLASTARAICTALGHKRGLGPGFRTIGGVACGQCWEHAIRDDERKQLAVG